MVVKPQSLVIGAEEHQPGQTCPHERNSQGAGGSGLHEAQKGRAGADGGVRLGTKEKSESKVSTVSLAVTQGLGPPTGRKRECEGTGMVWGGGQDPALGLCCHLELLDPRRGSLEARTNPQAEPLPSEVWASPGILRVDTDTGPQAATGGFSLYLVY